MTNIEWLRNLSIGVMAYFLHNVQKKNNENGLNNNHYVGTLESQLEWLNHEAPRATNYKLGGKDV